MSNLKEDYKEKIVPALMKELNITNKMAVPKLEKVVINIGTGQTKFNPKFAGAAKDTIEIITGQKPNIRKSKKAISGFKLRQGDEVGLAVTLRGERMYDFIQKFANVALPRIRDFRGLDPKSFDQKGNFTLGLRENLIFPEITHEKLELIHGLEITIVTSADSKESAQLLLEKLGFPFKKLAEDQSKEKNG